MDGTVGHKIGYPKLGIPLPKINSGGIRLVWICSVDLLWRTWGCPFMNPNCFREIMLAHLATLHRLRRPSRYSAHKSDRKFCVAKSPCSIFVTKDT
ncbi:Hypothetical protein NTJ_01205 [Nesidiocoris tenuis]|uniref:Uncharacterized protein n=1 Tax=Nesidiocoris tenuis TaxID=355587 RepID=A0ABN7AAU5_9HEMI|nr:Hypothetical protein NTJ_01205 [Nesidiocoris tenuis]